MEEKVNIQKERLTEEWVELVKEAMRSNITKEEFKRFLEEKKKNDR